MLFCFGRGVDWVGEESLGKDHRKSYMAARVSLRGRGDTHRKQFQSVTDCLCTYVWLWTCEVKNSLNWSKLRTRHWTPSSPPPQTNSVHSSIFKGMSLPIRPLTACYTAVYDTISSHIWKNVLKPHTSEYLEFVFLRPWDTSFGACFLRMVCDTCTCKNMEVFWME